MARLNEAPQPAVESIDALKRRFVRQNREIARANSTQSLRIRNLESEVSRLLSENISLREQIIKLKYEIEKNKSQSIEDNVTSVKAKLEEKLAELGGLVKELGQVQKVTGTRRASKRKSAGQSSPQRSPDQRNWKNVLTLSEATGGVDGRLPPILEDKYYPRRTMDAEELIGVLTDSANVTDSPDLGPPPVAHFDEGDPIKFDPKPERPSSKTTSGSREQSRPLPANLETRKKRRESSHHRETGDKKLDTQVSEETATMDSGVVKGQPLKTGAKRKLNVRDEEEEMGRSDDQEMFHFKSKTAELRTSESAGAKSTIIRTSKQTKERANQAAVVSVQARKNKAAEDRTTTTTTNRKALGPKSVNTDPANSPVKSKMNGKDRIAEIKDLVNVDRERAPQKEKVQISKSAAFAKSQGPAAIATSTSKNVDPPPETPAPPNDLFSPVSSEPSAARAESRDTPPPPDLGPDTGTGSFGRASRRSRGSINYAQPNLRDKMRRPTSELVDAVGAEERLRQANLARTERENTASVTIKHEDTESLPVWNTNDARDNQRKREEPTSPLSNKTSGLATDLPGSVITERRRRSIAPSRGENISDQSKPSGAASAIAALTAGNHRPKRTGEENSHVINGKDKLREPEERLSIFDFTGSSPADPGAHATDKDEQTTKPMRSASRRHSSVAASSDQGPGSLSISRRVERRKEAVLDTRREENAEKGIDVQLSRTKSVLELGAVDPDIAGEETSSGRGERAASRRRSMML